VRLANVDERLMVARAGGGFADLASASAGRFGPDPQTIYDRWEELADWMATAAEWTDVGYEPDPESLGAPVPRPRQVFATALNYRQHAAEGGSAAPAVPQVFTKFPSCITGPVTVVELATDRVDWEAELVVAIGRRAHRVSAAQAWDHVAGVTVGQDISARDVQRTSPEESQFSLGKSFPGFGPTGPWLVSRDEFGDGDARIECLVNGGQMQDGSTSDMIFPVAALIEYISNITPMLPGDLLFTGTPAGVGVHRDPPRLLVDGDVVVTRIERIGELRQTFRAMT
jgi:2-keto-4-pentenoate hydratase/2-oxohepta-3-ene-1,7-dioic acid hydratase in catechol pathway